MPNQIDVIVTKDKRHTHDPGGGAYFIPGGGTYEGDGETPFFVRHLVLEAVPETAQGLLADGRAIIPFGLVLLDGAAEATLTGRMLRITIEDIT